MTAMSRLAPAHRDYEYQVPPMPAVLGPLTETHPRRLGGRHDNYRLTVATDQHLRD
jgi:hypothetical protein